MAEPDLTRPIIGIEYRSAQEVFDIMCDRFKHAAPTSDQTNAEVSDERLRELLPCPFCEKELEFSENLSIHGGGWMHHGDEAERDRPCFLIGKIVYNTPGDIDRWNRRSVTSQASEGADEARILAALAPSQPAAVGELLTRAATAARIMMEYDAWEVPAPAPADPIDYAWTAQVINDLAAALVHRDQVKL